EKVIFLNRDTGFAVGSTIHETTDGGTNWFTVNEPAQVPIDDITILNTDTIWIVVRESLTGGVFRTTNGGMNWTQQLNLGSQNPVRIYMYNSSTGFISNNSGTYLRRTTNSGVNWDVIPGENGFTDIE